MPTVGNTPAFAFANYGYDVWLGNYRGTQHSNQHVNYSQSDSEYWDYTIDEIIEYDVSSMIDYVLKVTDKKQLGYIGISQGNTILFGLLASHPEYNAKLKPFIAIAPVTVTNLSFSIVPRFLKEIFVPQIRKFLLLWNGPALPFWIIKLLRWSLTQHPFIFMSDYFGYAFIVAVGGRLVNWSRLELAFSKLGLLFGRKSFGK